ncbi:hypothetical protein [Sphaerisporangium corydalis]|uniref:Uncharacterized protein n=1 Tax=Sphaerisporangium corydalis TaxID=1441875 RepID=A0ABV9EJT2_9ACTN|nr:hypothetical protein [Sphaerisporangium corydalis]
MNTVTLILLLAAFVAFLLAAINANVPRVNLIGLGLALLVLTELIPVFQKM